MAHRVIELIHLGKYALQLVYNVLKLYDTMHPTLVLS
jgi:hypothetical protein